MEALRCGHEAQLAALRQEHDVKDNTLRLERQQVDARHEVEQQWLDGQHRTETDEMVAKQQQVNDELCRAEHRMLAEQQQEAEDLQQHLDNTTCQPGGQAASEESNEALQCPISHDTMVDPIVASDGHTYDRFSAFLAIDSDANMPGPDAFQILVDNIGIRQTLFQEVPGSYQLWLDARSEYIASITTAAAYNDWPEVQLRAQRAFAFLPPDDNRRAGIEAILRQAVDPDSHTMLPPELRQADEIALDDRHDEQLPPLPPASVRRSTSGIEEHTESGLGNPDRDAVLQNHAGNTWVAAANGSNMQRSSNSFTSRGSGSVVLGTELELSVRHMTSTPLVQQHGSAQQPCNAAGFEGSHYENEHEENQTPSQAGATAFEAMQGQQAHQHQARSPPWHTQWRQHERQQQQQQQLLAQSGEWLRPSRNEKYLSDDAADTAHVADPLPIESANSHASGANQATEPSMPGGPPVSAPRHPGCRILVGGGNISQFAVDAYNPATGTWECGGNLDAALVRPATAVLPGGQLLVAGGIATASKKISTTVETTAKVRLLNPSSCTWNVLAPMKKPRSHAAAVFLPAHGPRADSVLVAGGLGDCLVARKTCEVYSCSSGSWTATGEMLLRRAEFAMTILPDGRALATGGHSGTAVNSRKTLVTKKQPLRSCEVLCSRNKKWSSMPDMLAARCDHAMAALPDGRIIVIGGRTSHDRSTEFFDAASFCNGGSGSWTPGPDLPAGISGPLRVCKLPGGRLCVMGVEGGRAESAIYDPDAADQPWSSSPSTKLSSRDNGPFLAVVAT